MNTIKFSHEYPKLHGQTSAELLAVRPLKIDAHTPRELIEYDTTHNRGRYPLRSGFYIQLIFLGNLRIPFCTIRSAYPPSKVRYYYNSVGRTFKIETPEPPTCDTCKHFCGMHQQEIDFDTGDTMLVVSCDIQMHATPDLAKSCVFYQRRAAK